MQKFREFVHSRKFLSAKVSSFKVIALVKNNQGTNFFANNNKERKYFYYGFLVSKGITLKQQSASQQFYLFMFLSGSII